MIDPDIPADVRLEAFNPFIPGEVDARNIPVAILRYHIQNTTDESLRVSVCGSLPNFIGNDGSKINPDWLDGLRPVGEKQNVNTFRIREKSEGDFYDLKWGAPSGRTMGYHSHYYTEKK